MPDPSALPRRRVRVLRFAEDPSGASAFRSTFGGLTGFALLPARADALAAGCLLAIAVRQPGAEAVFWEYHMLILRDAAVSLLAWILLASIRHRAPYAETVSTLLFGCLVAVAAFRSPSALGSTLEWRPLVWVGRMSYAVYLFHMPVAMLLFLAANKPMSLASFTDVAILVSSLVLTLILAEVSRRALEESIIAIGHRFRYRSASAAPAV